MDQYIKDVIDSRGLLIVERAVDEYIQAENEILVETETPADSFCDGCISDEEIGDMIDSLADDDVDFTDPDYDQDLSMEDPMTLYPEIEELD